MTSDPMTPLATPQSLLHSLAHSTGAHLPSMRAPFRFARSVNPDAYDAKLDFWTHAIHLVCVQNGLGLASRYTIDARTLPAALATEGMPPMGLPTVLREMKNKGSIETVEEFLRGNGRGIKGGSGGGGLWGAVAWGLSVLGVWSSASSKQPPEANGISSGVFVLGERVQSDVAALASVAQSVSSLTDSIMTVDELLGRSHLASSTTSKLSKTDVDVLVHAAHCAGVLAFDPKTRLVKLVGWRQAGKEGERAQMTALDQQLYTLKHTAAMVAKQVDEIEGRIDGLLDQARAHLRASKKPLATRCLAQKKSLSTLLIKRTATLDTLSHMLAQIDSADSDAAVMGAYQAGTSALKDLLADPRLKLDNVDATMDQVAEVLADHREVEEAISVHTTGINNEAIDSAGVDADELERELEMLVVEELLEKRAPKTVPTTKVEVEGKGVTGRPTGFNVQTSPLPQERPAAIKLHARTASDREEEEEEEDHGQGEGDTVIQNADASVHQPVKKKAKISEQQMMLAE